MKYPVLIHKESSSDFGVTVPDLPGCYSAGTTMEEALESAHEAVLTRVEGLLIDQEPIPTPSSVESLLRKWTVPGTADPASLSPRRCSTLRRSNALEIKFRETLWQLRAGDPATPPLPPGP